MDPRCSWSTASKVIYNHVIPVLRACRCRWRKRHRGHSGGNGKGKRPRCGPFPTCSKGRRGGDQGSIELRGERIKTCRPPIWSSAAWCG